MMKHFFILFIFPFLLLNCKSDTNDSENIQEVQPANGKLTSDKLADIKANAIDENDRFARVNHSLGVLQKEYKLSGDKVTGQGKMIVFIDEKFTMLIKNTIDDDVYETRINLKNLDPENGSMKLISENAPGEFPGFRIAVMEGKPGVKITKNGEVIGEERELKIFLGARENVERAVPAFVQAMNVVHGRT